MEFGSFRDPRLKGAKCADEDPELFFPVGSRGRRYEEQVEQAKAVCHSCPVEQVCREVAIEKGEKFGIWGGQTEYERADERRLATQRKVAAAALESAQSPELVEERQAS